jgi:hypothetical protein
LGSCLHQLFSCGFCASVPLGYITSYTGILMFIKLYHPTTCTSFWGRLNEEVGCPWVGFCYV